MIYCSSLNSSVDAGSAKSIPPYFTERDLDLESFDRICKQSHRTSDFPLAESIQQKVIVYRGARVREALTSSETESEWQSEWCRCLSEGSGIFLVEDAFSDTRCVDEMTSIFRSIVSDEKASRQSKGDHFGDNERIWNSFQKACIRAPEATIDYYGNPILALASRAWLGPHYQITAQVNVVKPGGAAQSPHRDYHLGFQSDSTTAQFPAHAQIMSQFLTFQGAIIHTDMPLESGPTLFLPYSHQYPAGYMAFRKPEFVTYFETHHVQLPLRKGDAVFFNPAVFHGAGANTSDKDRIGNLVQISSAFGRAMETLNRDVMVKSVYPVLLARTQQGAISERTTNDIVAAVADGYSFPTNLDSDPPVDGNAPETTQQLVHNALQEQWTLEELTAALARNANRRRASWSATAEG